MAIAKQEFYEGAALHQLLCSRGLLAVRYEAPFFILDDAVACYLKYSTRARSPWGFTFAPEEHLSLLRRGRDSRTVIGLICGADGVAAVEHSAYLKLVPTTDAS